MVATCADCEKEKVSLQSSTISTTYQHHHDDSSIPPHLTQSQPQQLSGIVFYCIAVILCLGLCIGIVATRWRNMPTNYSTMHNNSHQDHQNNRIAFTTIHIPDWNVLSKAILAHEHEQHTILEQLSRSLQIALQTEQDLCLEPTLSTSLKQRITALAQLFEQNMFILKSQILQPFELQSVLSDGSSNDGTRDTTFDDTHNPLGVEQATSTTMLGYCYRATKSSDSSASYDTIQQVMAHLVRDWSPEGASIRENLYSWCLAQLPSTSSNKQQHQQQSILLPGAGMGRLAFDLAVQGHRVHAIETSLSMMSAVSWLFQSTDSIELHPYVSDALTNEVDSNLRYTPVTILCPDVSLIPTEASLSFTLTDFVHLPMTPGSYDVVVTCFFIDTATNIFDYIQTIHKALSAAAAAGGNNNNEGGGGGGGMWINVGPIQWHRNAQLFPSGDELRAMITNMGFVIEHWSVDQQPMEYRNRNEQQHQRSTHYDSYCPLRFVARKI